MTASEGKGSQAPPAGMALPCHSDALAYASVLSSQKSATDSCAHTTPT